MLSDGNDGARLRPFIPFAWVHGETHLVSHNEFVETVVWNRIAMEVNFRAIALVEEPIILIGNEINDPAVGRDLMSVKSRAIVTP